MPPSTAHPFPLWPLPVAIAVLFTAAAHLGLWLSIRDGYVQACIPVLEGCTSISRAGRHGLANHVFRLLVLPCALLVGVHWWLVARWLGRSWRDVAWLGGVAAIALAVYATFLGSEGEAYRFLRRYGVVCFFGFGYLAQLRFLRGAGEDVATRGIVRAMIVVSAMMLLLGVGSVAATAMVDDAWLKDRVENALEWQLGWLLAAWYLLHAAWWRRQRATLRLQ
ncbi:hypothetical protein [uncultured Luteimonas sp.]|uniref:hypothetical protein n=1 Tax=uncultured Luteimonas sp. TaxID=453144 RepID=UPI00261E50E3|nr:hypothetical protein [uncultured Luteimonas sp.]